MFFIKCFIYLTWLHILSCLISYFLILNQWTGRGFWLRVRGCFQIQCWTQGNGSVWNPQIEKKWHRPLAQADIESEQIGQWEKKCQWCQALCSFFFFSTQGIQGAYAKTWGALSKRGMWDAWGALAARKTLTAYRKQLAKRRLSLPKLHCAWLGPKRCYWSHW